MVVSQIYISPKNRFLINRNWFRSVWLWDTSVFSTGDFKPCTTTPFSTVKPEDYNLEESLEFEHCHCWILHIYSKWCFCLLDKHYSDPDNLSFQKSMTRLLYQLYAKCIKLKWQYSLSPRIHSLAVDKCRTRSRFTSYRYRRDWIEWRNNYVPLITRSFTLFVAFFKRLAVLWPCVLYT